MFPRGAKGEIVLQVESREVGFGGSAGDAGQFTVGGVGDAGNGGKAAASGDFGIEIELGVGRKAQPKKERGGDGDVALGFVVEAVYAGVSSGKFAMILTNGRGLPGEIPAFFWSVLLGEQKRGCSQDNENSV